MTIRQKFWSGYLPYTGAVVAALVLLAVLSSGPAASTAFFVVLVLGAGFSLYQLLILALPARRGDRARFHTDCMLITLAGLLVIPILLQGFLMLVRSQ